MGFVPTSFLGPISISKVVTNGYMPALPCYIWSGPMYMLLVCRYCKFARHGKKKFKLQIACKFDLLPCLSLQFRFFQFCHQLSCHVHSFCIIFFFFTSKKKRKKRRRKRLNSYLSIRFFSKKKKKKIPSLS
jgi:hypothetical protein